jgi:hypothetical protein
VTVVIASDAFTTVSTRATWAGSWNEEPFLEALAVNLPVAPSHGDCRLRYRYGKVIAPAIGSRDADDVAAVIPRPNLVGYYVRVEISGVGTFYGVIQDDADQQHGFLNATDASGVKNYIAFGLTWLLANSKPILQSKVKYSGGTWIIDRAVPFNGGTDGRSERRRVAWKNYDATNLCFTDSSQSVAPTAWKASTAIEYLVANFGPKSSAGTVLVPFVLDTDSADYLDYELPMVEYEGQTIWEVINRLVDRRRGLLLFTSIVDNEVVLIVRSQNQTTITLPSGSEIPANPDQVTYDFDNAVNVTDATITSTLLTQYDQIVCLGDRAGSVFTVRPQTNVQADWTSTQKDAYNAAASVLTGYSSLSDDDKHAANEDRRAADDLAPVFSWWRLSHSWTARADTDPSSGTHNYAFPKINADGVEDLEAFANVQRGGLRVEPYVPLRTGVNYSGDITPATDDADLTDKDYLPPLLLLKATAIRASGDAGWVHCERLPAAFETGSTKRPYAHSVDLAVREDVAGLILKVQGAPQHYIASDQYTANASFEDIPAGVGISHQDWLATIYMKQDQYCRAQYPLDDDLPVLDLVRQKVLRLPGSNMDYVVPGTVVGVAGGEVIKTNGGFVRDDRKRLADIARLAFSWYGQPRRILNLSFRGIVSGFELGQLITSVGSGETAQVVNTAITAISYDLKSGRTTISTQFSELDFSDGN